MKYDEIIGQLSNFPKIIVTGPQRSGTTIAGRMIANDLEYQYIDEGVHASNTNTNRLRLLLKDAENVVIQCPILASKAHWIASWDQNNIAIVYMNRNVDDIQKSQKRINWDWDEAEKHLIEGVIQLENIPIEMDYSMGISTLKYRLWNEYQESKVKNSFNLEYESMAEHPLWLVKEKRENFTAKQTTL